MTTKMTPKVTMTSHCWQAQNSPHVLNSSLMVEWGTVFLFLTGACVLGRVGGVVMMTEEAAEEEVESLPAAIAVRLARRLRKVLEGVEVFIGSSAKKSEITLNHNFCGPSLLCCT